MKKKTFILAITLAAICLAIGLGSGVLLTSSNRGKTKSILEEAQLPAEVNGVDIFMDYVDTIGISQKEKEEEARGKAIVIENFEREIAERESILKASEEEIDVAEKEMVQMQKEHELDWQAKLNSEIGRSEQMRERVIQFVQEGREGYAKIEKQFDEAMAAGRAEIAEGWRYVEFLRDCLRIVKYTDDPELASELIAIEVEAYNEITALNEDYEKTKARKKREQERTERALERELERKFIEIEGKYK